jgi:hypothetical protein
MKFGDDELASDDCNNKQIVRYILLPKKKVTGGLWLLVFNREGVRHITLQQQHGSTCKAMLLLVFSKEIKTSTRIT